MGLDISAVSKIKESEEAEGHFYVGVDEFGRHSLPQGWYKDSDESRGHGFRAGSYSGYNAFRNDLCKFVTDGASDKEVWANIRGYEGMCFMDLIDFSDCQGVIGAEVSGRLHQDFVENRESFKEWLYKNYKEDEEMVEYRLEVYDDFTLAFEIAKEDGIVIFC